MQVSKQDTIMITGADGFVGRFIVQKLIVSGYKKLLLNIRKPDGTGPPGVPRTTADLADPGAIVHLIGKHKPDHVIHLAAVARLAEGENNPDKAYRVNYLGTRALVKSALAHQVKTFVFVSTDMVRDLKSVVGITKFLAESAINDMETGNTRMVTVRLPNVSWTPGSVHTIFQQLIREGKPLTVTHPEMSRRFLNGEEAAEMVMLGLTTVGHKGILVVTNPPMKIIRLGREMISESGKNLEIRIIGMRAGEKLAEKGYEDNEVIHTSIPGLSLLKTHQYDRQKVLEALDMLKEKPGFTLVKETIEHV